MALDLVDRGLHARMTDQVLDEGPSGVAASDAPDETTLHQPLQLAPSLHEDEGPCVQDEQRRVMQQQRVERPAAEPGLDQPLELVLS